MSFPAFLYDQRIRTLPYPTGSYENKTVVITGSNVGLGKEAARHFARLGASTLILAVRNLEKGDAAKKDIEQSTNCAKDVIQVWQLDMTNYDSVQKFAARTEKDLKRVDIFIANAGVARTSFSKAEDNELTITVNVVSTFLLALLMIPKLKETSKKFNTRPTLSITSSEVHSRTTLPEKSAPDGEIFHTLNDESKADMYSRYPVSKLLEVFGVRAIAERYPASSLPVTINCLNPGLCHSELARDAGWRLWLLKLLFARTTEYGSRTLVHAASQGPGSHGKYLSNCEISQPSPFVLSDEGKKTQDRVWDELVTKLEAIKPGITSNL
ncbi:short-chain dehydrogenase [Glonium stellatum]|uniref:Short-chain dehydrogenase n=1 Tax=Glonium stellatum TaxID=574774 RepID=A0A8E2ENJ5_9PEZI|nr:short-chain dehydrogenase [Glonium stellatum]